MRFIFGVIKNIIAVVAIIAIVFFALKYAPFLKEQEWNPLHENRPTFKDSPVDPQMNNGKRYSLESNDLLNNVPPSQIKKVFNWVDKKEFMSVSGLQRMGYNDKYIAGQRQDKFVIYKFGSDSMRVYTTEIEMEQDLAKLGQHIKLKPRQSYE